MAAHWARFPGNAFSVNGADAALEDPAWAKRNRFEGSFFFFQTPCDGKLGHAVLN